METRNKIIIAVSIFIGGLGIGIGSTYLYMKPKPISGNQITTIGDTDNIKIKEVIVYRDRVVTKIVAKDEGEITATFNKEQICPEIFRKHILGFSINPFYQNRSFYLGYHVDYQRIFKNRFILTTGLNINQNLLSSTVEGVGGKIGFGILFGGK